MSDAYPAHDHNPIPWGGDEAAWKRWVERSVILADSGAVCLTARPDLVVAKVEESPVMLNPIGSFHGGMVAGLADAIAGAVFCISVPEGILPATANLSVEYHRPAFGPLTFTARTVNQGRTLLFAEVDVHARDDRLCNRAHVVLAKKSAEG